MTRLTYKLKTCNSTLLTLQKSTLAQCENFATFVFCVSSIIYESEKAASELRWCQWAPRYATKLILILNFYIFSFRCVLFFSLFFWSLHSKRCRKKQIRCSTKWSQLSLLSLWKHEVQHIFTVTLKHILHVAYNLLLIAYIIITY